MLENATWKMTPSRDTVFGLYMFAKNIYTNLKFGMPDVQAWLYNIGTYKYAVFWIFRKFWIVKKSYKNVNIFNFGGKKNDSPLSLVGALAPVAPPPGYVP